MEPQAAKVDLRALSKPVVSRIWFDLIWNCAVIVAAYALYFKFPNGFTLIALFAIAGIHWHRLGVMGHDACHFLFFKNRRWNDWIANVFCFYPLTTTVAGYRAWHFDHHRHLGTDKDPELVIKNGRLYERPFTRKMFFGMGVLDSFGLGFLELIKLMFVIRPKKTVDLLALILFWALVTWSAWKLGRLDILAFHILSLFTGFWVVFRVRNWSEHVGIAGTHRFTCHPFFRYVFFPHNTWCHYEHHKWAAIPYMNLLKAREADQTVRVQTLNELFTFFADTPKKTI